MADHTDKKSTEAQDQIRAAVRATTAGASESVQRGAAAAEQSTHSANAALREGAGATAQAAQYGVEAGEQTMRHMGEVAGAATRHGARMFAEGQQRLFANATEQMQRAANTMAQAVQESAQDMRALMVMPRMNDDTVEDVRHGMERLVSGVVETNLRSAQELLRLGNPSQFFLVQQHFMRDYLEALVEGSAVLVRSVRRAAEQTLRPFEQQLEQRRQESNGRGNGAEQHGGRVADVMDRELRVANPDDTVQQAARMMRDSDTGVLPVGEGDRLVGMLTDRDVAVRLIAEGRDPARTKVREVMTPDVRYVYEDQNLDDVANNMAEQQVRRLPVVNRAKRLVGVVSLSDIAGNGRQASLAGRALGGITREGGQHTQTAAE